MKVEVYKQELVLITDVKVGQVVTVPHRPTEPLMVTVVDDNEYTMGNFIATVNLVTGYIHYLEKIVNVHVHNNVTISMGVNHGES